MCQGSGATGGHGRARVTSPGARGEACVHITHNRGSWTQQRSAGGLTRWDQAHRSLRPCLWGSVGPTQTHNGALVVPLE